MRKIYGGICVIERIISRAWDAPAKFAPTLKLRKGMRGTVEASNDGRVRVRIFFSNTSSWRIIALIGRKNTRVEDS